MSPWSNFPSNYRSKEVQFISRAVQAGECVLIVGLSGAGKSNLLGFLAHRVGERQSLPSMVLIDCNRLLEISVGNLFHLIRTSIGEPQSVSDEFNALYELIGHQTNQESQLCLLFDRFEVFTDAQGDLSNLSASSAIFGNLRALRDTHKYTLTYVVATRRPLDPDNELSELFFANTLWLGPLSESDAIWNIHDYAQRKDIQWDEATTHAIIDSSKGYPSFLRAVCEAVSSGANPEINDLLEHPVVRRRVDEFWAAQPNQGHLRKSGLIDHPFLATTRPLHAFDTAQLTAKEHLLWEHLINHPNQVCEKDDLIRAVWPEDQIYEQGIRDDSLARLVRRLREKIEPDPSNPRYIQTIPGRGYRFISV